MNYMGIDLGATKTAVCVGNKNGRILATERIPTNGDRPADEYFERLFPACHHVLDKAGVRADQIERIGIGAPGPVDLAAGTIMESPNMPAWHNVTIRKNVATVLDRPVAMNNDANAAALAEFYFGKYRGTQNMICLTHSTGMGGGIIAAGELVQGVTDTGGEVGHHILDPNGPPCGCGMHGCFEAFCGGRNAAHRLREKIDENNIDTLILEKAGGVLENIDFKAFADAAKEGDPFACREWDVYIERLAQGIGNLIMIMNPAVVLLGTIAIHTGAFLMDPLAQRLPKYVWKWPLEACTLDTSTLGSDIGAFGALAVAVHG